MNDNLFASNSPLVSVIIPAYNAEAFIEKTLNSVLSQTYKNLEVVVVDDGSPDKTAEVVKAIAQKDRRIILLQQTNLGVAAARNLAIQHSKGELIAPIDADDIWYPQNLEKQVQGLLQADGLVGLVYAWSVDIDEQDRPTGEFRASSIEGHVYKTLICHNFIGNASASLMRRTCLDKIGGYNFQLRDREAQGCEDWELYLRIAEYYQFRVVPEFLIGYRKIASSMSGDYRTMAKSHASMLEAVRQKHPEIPAMLFHLSSSSFYMYLARQSSHYSSAGNTLFWLSKVLQADWITPLFRYGLYWLMLKSILRIIAESSLSLIGSSDRALTKNNKRPVSAQRLTKISDFNRRKISIKFKLLVGSALHRLLSMMRSEQIDAKTSKMQELPNKELSHII